jgi:hypothetical protein
MKASRRILVVVLGVLALALPCLSVGWARVASRPPDRYLALIVLDGFRPDYMTLAPMRQLHALMRTGMTYTQAWVGQLEAQTPTGHATLVTGVYPRKHGVIGFGWRDPTGQNFSWMPTDLRQLNAGAMETLIESSRVPTLSDLLHREVPGAKSASLSGEKYYAADAMGAGADYILYGKHLGKQGLGGMEAVPIGQHVPPASTRYRAVDISTPPYPWVQDQFAAHLAVRLLSAVRPRMLFINLPGPDIEGHITGGPPDRPDMRQVASGVDKAIGAIVAAYKQAGLYDRTVFVVTADHGMVPNTHLVPIKTMYAGVRATGVLDLEDDFLTTAGYVYLRNPAQAASVASYLAARHYPGVEGALYKVSTPSGLTCQAETTTAESLGQPLTRAYLHLCDTVAATNGPDVVLPYKEDTMGLVVPHSRHWGTHGGLSWRVQHIPLVLSGSGIRHSQSDFPAQLVDVAPTIERVLRFPVPAGVDGIVLADALAHPEAQDWAAQRAKEPGRLQDVRALLTHSLRQNGAVLQR